MKACKQIWLVNIGETLPVDGEKPLRMNIWKQHLQSLGYEVVFFTTDFEHQRKRWVTNPPKGYVLLKSRIGYKQNMGMLRLANHFFAAYSFWMIARRQKKLPEVIITSYPTILLSFLVVLFSNRKGIKAIIDIRDKWPDIFITNKLFKWVLTPWLLLKDYIMRNASDIIAISPEYYKWALKNNNVPVNNILPLVTSTNGFYNSRSLNPQNPIVFIFIGTLGDTYDLDSIHKLHDTLVRFDIKFNIQVCGDGPDREDFLKKAKLRPQIVYRGWLNEEELKEAIKNANFGLMSYYADSPQGWPNKLFEYMSFGLPIINLLKGESWDLIAQNGLGKNVDQESFDDVVPWIKDLISNPVEYNRISENNITCFNEQFSNDRVLKKLIKIIE